MEGEDTCQCRSNRITTTQARQIKTLRFGSEGILTAAVQKLPQDLGVDSEFGTKDLLALVYDAGRAGRFRSADGRSTHSTGPSFANTYTRKDVVAPTSSLGADSVQLTVADWGTRFIVVAGLLNIIAAVDAHNLRTGRKPGV